MTAYEMGVYAWLINAQFVVALGDNFYNDGVESTSDSLWQSAFHDVYNSQYLQIPWYPVLGNHDYHGSPDSQVQRTLVDEGIWTMPSRYYAFNFTLNDGGNICFLFIDTCLLNPEQGDTESMLEDYSWKQRKSDHLQWIDDVLSEQNKTSTWMVVAGHYPIYSMGEHGDDAYLIKDLLPILLKHKVHAYFAGHDHLHEHIEMHDMHFFVTGGSGGRGPLGPHGYQNLYETAAMNNVKHWFQTCGFAFAEVDSSAFNVTYVDNLGRVRYTASMTNPRNVHSISMFGNGLPGLGVPNSVVSTLMVVGGVIIAALIIAYLGTRKYPLELLNQNANRKIRLNPMDSSAHSALSLNASSRSGSVDSSRRNARPAADFRV
eukprot:CAMPEP_0182428158 /NCGR_PEP_ID=MMETSP1167-20130531/21065_1 /TAXON_ID=2988 /ORGANISM="Mallomonas Sp, Strain CCMP3275" /LENGTH=373 /DNA_ID=CAMNT_0024610861 /DNA_START=395 /DNA_END=1516 /DNA_ORIENTATION=-